MRKNVFVILPYNITTGLFSRSQQLMPVTTKMQNIQRKKLRGALAEGMNRERLPFCQRQAFA